MQTQKPGAPEPEIRQETITVTPFASARMGLAPGQTLVKIDTYNIACVPYRLSLSGAVLLASFSPQEMAFFQRFANGLAGVTVVFQPANAQQPIKVFARCLVKSITPMRGRASIGLVSVAWKPCPPDICSMVEDYLGMMDRLKAEYEDFKGKPVRIDAASAAAMGYNNFTELGYGAEKVKAAVFAVASDRLDFLLPMAAQELRKDAAVSAKLYFRSFQFTVAATVAEIARLPSGVQKGSLSLAFSPELVDILERYRFHERFAVDP